MNSNQRILEIFFLLYQGEKIYIDELVLRYQVSKRTIQRDLSSIKDAIDNTISNELTLIYNANHRYYSIKKNESTSYGRSFDHQQGSPRKSSNDQE